MLERLGQRRCLRFQKSRADIVSNAATLVETLMGHVTICYSSSLRLQIAALNVIRVHIVLLILGHIIELLH